MAIQSIGGIEVTRAKAEKFVNANDRVVDRLARRAFNSEYGEENKKFDKRANATLKTLPLVAVASGLAMCKGIKGSLLSGLGWGMALAAPTIVSAANKVVTKASPSVEKAERKHPVATGLASLAASLGTFVGLTKLANKAMNKPKIANGVDSAFNKVAGMVSGARSKVAEKLAQNKSVVNFVEKTAAAKKNILKNPVAKEVFGAMGKIGRKLVQNAPTLVVFGTLGALLAKGMSNAKKVADIRNGIRDEQFRAAKDVINSYSTENEVLKQENEFLAQSLEEKVVDKAPAKADSAEQVEEDD